MMARATPRLAVARTIADLRAAVSPWRAAGDRVALVPTMGALHAGHLALVDAARGRAGRTVVSIFVNSRQFGAGEDLALYPRDEAGDLARLAARAVDLVYLPPPEVMYPAGFATIVAVAGLADRLCGAARPGHFAGVATVVTKLFAQVAPDVALFGEKDYQQLTIIRRLVADLDLAVDIVGVPTVRESDGLALSSRNAFLSVEDRARAPQLFAALNEAGAQLRGGAPARVACDAARVDLGARGFRVDYVELGDATNLEPMARLDRPARLLAAAWLGQTRLIDNVALVPS